ncbi:intraflagellar transport protein 122 homolog [Oscarella lobularis]|uniref:intraflagellar transport protein 122 homolog n=1 Tax=Oscarella lobularis TaxID=121494 RepID=UPI0033131D10
MRIQATWFVNVTDREEQKTPIYSVVFNCEGTQVYVAAGNRVVVYDAGDGSLIQTLKGHKDTVYCLACSKDGERFASGGADKSVIIWTSQLDGILKYSHNDSVQSLAYNPTSQLLASCTNNDFGLWSPEQKSVVKHKVSSRITCCSWTNDGQYLALGMYSGTISIRNKNGDEKVKIERPAGCPVWSLSWSPQKEDSTEILAVADWGQKLSFYQLNGRQIGKDKNLGFDPCCLSYFPGGDYFLLSGSDNQISLYSKEGVRLCLVAELDSWIWTCHSWTPKLHGNVFQYFVVAGCQDGKLMCYQLAANTVHGLYKDRYAYRDNMTDVVVQHLISSDKTKIRCREMIKKIAVCKDRLAVQLPDKIVIYELIDPDSEENIQYRVKDKIHQKIDCNLLVVCNNHIVLCQEKQLQCLSFTGVKEREWDLDSVIRYIKVIGGPPGREGLLVGLRDGQILNLFIDNPFPIVLLKQQSSIRCLDLSASRTKLAVVDEHNSCVVFDVNTKEILFQEPNANSVAWNTLNENMLCFSGEGCLNIKASDFPVHRQKMQGFVVGFSGSKIFCLQSVSMTSVDVPQSASMYRYLEKRMFLDAFDVACLGVTEGDWRALAMEALEHLDLKTARKAFIRIRDIRYLELIQSIEERKKRGEGNDDLYLADVYAYEGKHQDAARLYKKAGFAAKAMDLFSDLRQFEYAKEFMTGSDQTEVKQLIKKQAEWCNTTNDPKAASDMFMTAGDYKSAIEIIGGNGWMEKLMEVARSLSRAQSEELNLCAHYFKQNGHHSYAADIYTRLNDNKALVELHVDSHHWDEAFGLAEDHPEFTDSVYMPYATWLAENDRFDEAQKAFHRAGRSDEAGKVLEQLLENALNENRFTDASYYYWLLAKQSLDDTISDEKTSEESRIAKFDEYYVKAEMYYMYQAIQKYTDEPFTSHMPEVLFHTARYLLNLLSKSCPPGISRVKTLYTLAKQSQHLGAYKLARHAYDRLQSLQVPFAFQETVDLGSITIRSKPFHDKEELLPVCYRCSTTNPLLNSLGNRCINCQQPFVYSFYSFEVLPLVHFVLEDGISDAEAVEFICKETDASTTERDQWKESASGNVQSLRLTDEPERENLFTAQLLNFEHGSTEYRPVVANRAMLLSMHENEVVVQKWPPPKCWTFYKNIMSDVTVALDTNSQKLFLAEDYDLLVLQSKLPFTHSSTQLG